MTTKHIWLILLILISGCGPWQNKEMKETIKIVNTEKQDFKGNLNTEYPTPSNQDLKLTASGNATINVNIPTAEAKLTKVSNKTQGSMQSETSFSFDKYLKSVSLGGWVAVMLAFCCVLFTIVYFINKTMVGKALDAAASASITGAQGIIGELNEKMMIADPNTSAWNELNAMKNTQAAKLQTLLANKR